MKITVLCVGKIKEKYFTLGIDEYAKRLSRYCKLEIIEVADEKTPDNASENEELQIKAKEGDKLLRYIKDNAFVIALAIEGKMLTSEELSFSKMTFPHQMMRMVLLEQVYRGYRIMKGEPYHK